MSLKQRSRFPFTSVIVPVYKNIEGLGVLLKSLENQSYPRNNYEVIIVNNDPHEDISTINEEFSFVHIVSEANEGSYHARNTGIMASRGEILAFTDSDCIPEPDWLLNGVHMLGEIGNIGMVAGNIKVVFLDPLQPNVCELYDSLCSFRQREFLEKSKFGVTANLFTTMATIEAVGLFDSQMKSGGDCEWGMRVFRNGYPQVYCAKAIIRHPARRSLSTLIQKSLRVTVGTMNTHEKYNYTLQRRKQYIWHHLVERPLDFIKKLTDVELSVSPLLKFKVLGIYYLIKGLQLLERTRVCLGGKNRR